MRTAPELKLKDLNAYYGSAHAGVDLHDRVERSLRGAGLWDEVKDRLGGPDIGLSGDQQQRLCIARTIAVEPQVILMDEPASALDPIATHRIEELIEELKRRYTLVLVTHNMQQAARVADTTAFFLLGELVEHAPTTTVFMNPSDPARSSTSPGSSGSRRYRVPAARARRRRRKLPIARPTTSSQTMTASVRVSSLRGMASMLIGTRPRVIGPPADLRLAPAGAGPPRYDCGCSRLGAVRARQRTQEGRPQADDDRAQPGEHAVLDAEPGDIVAYCSLAALQGVLVVLPRPVGLAALARLRSPGWAVMLPGALMVGTFGVLGVPHGATELAVLAAIATPLLVAVAVIWVIRGRRGVWFAALPVLSAGAVTLDSWPSELATSALAALGCLAVGAALVRLMPLPWLAGSIAAMCIVDAALLATGVGQPAAHQLEIALAHSPLPEFHRAQLGSINRDYPDLVVAATLGSALAGSARQLTAGVLVAVLGSANGALFLVADILPATVPVGAAAAVVVLVERRRTRTRRAARASLQSPAVRRSTRWPEVEPAEA